MSKAEGRAARGEPGSGLPSEPAGTDTSGDGGSGSLTAGGCDSNRRRLVGRPLDIAAMPRVLKYERGSDLELWELWAL